MDIEDASLPVASALSAGSSAPDSATQAIVNAELLERAKLEHDTWMDEYKALRAEIVQTKTSSRQTTQFAILAIAGQVTLAGYIVQNDLPILFLIAPFVFYAIAWTQLRLEYVSLSISNYINTHLKKGVTAVHDTIAAYKAPIRTRGGNASLSKRLMPLDFDSINHHEMHSYKRRLWIIEASAFVIPLVAAALLPGAYFSYIRHYHAPISDYAAVYIYLNEAVFIYTIMMAIWMRRFGQGVESPYRQQPTRYCDLFVFQVINFAYQVLCRLRQFYRHVRLFLKRKPVRLRSGRRCYVPWYTRPVQFLLLALYRLCRIMVWACIASLTYGHMRSYNLAQHVFAKKNATTFLLKDGRKLTGIVIEVQGTTYIINSHNDRRELDKAMVKSTSP